MTSEQFLYLQTIRENRPTQFVVNLKKCCYCGMSIVKLRHVARHHKVICYNHHSVTWLDRDGVERTASIATKDHIIPKSLGGPQNFNNIAWCCRDCNEKKGNRLLEQILIMER